MCRPGLAGGVASCCSGCWQPLLFTQLLSQQSVVADDDYLLIEARIVAERQADGSVAVWLEVRRSDDGWDEWVSPRDRVLPADAELDLWHDTGSFTVAGVTGLLRLSLRRIARGHVELALQRGIEQGDDGAEGWAERLLPRLRRLDSPRFGPRMFTTTSIDLVDEGPALCRPGAIVRSGGALPLPRHARRVRRRCRWQRELPGRATADRRWIDWGNRGRAPEPGSAHTSLFP